MSNDPQFLDARGKPIEKAAPGCDTFNGWAQLTDGGFIPKSYPWSWWQQDLPVYFRDSCAAAAACISRYAQSVATLPIEHHRVLDNHGRERITTSALSRILRTPNSYQTRSDFFLNLVRALMAAGNAYALAYRNERQEVDALHLMPPHSCYPYIDPDSRAVFYMLGNNPLLGEIEAMIPQRDVLHIRLETPRHPLIGVSPLENVTLAMAINTAISGNQAAFFSNMSRPSGVISSDQMLTREQMMGLREAWEEQSKGINAGKVPFLAWGMKWQPMTITSEDAQLIDAFRLSVEEIARAFNVPLALIGDYTKATYNNTETLLSHWLATGLGFVLEHIEGAFMRFFKLPADEIVDFRVDNLLRTDFATRIDALTKGIAGGLYAPNEARAREGLPAMEYGDEPRVQQQVVPLSQVGRMPEPAAAPDAPPPAPDDDAEQEQARMIKQQLRLVVK